MKRLLIFALACIGLAISLPASASGDTSPPSAISVIDYDADYSEPVIFTVDSYSFDYPFELISGYSSPEITERKTFEASAYLFTYGYDKDFRLITEGMVFCRSFDC